MRTEHIYGESPQLQTTKSKKFYQYILWDVSGSMQGDKLKASKEGIKKIYETRMNSDVYLKPFSGYSNMNEFILNDYSINIVDKTNADGGTPLYIRMYELMDTIRKKYTKEDSVIFSIFTDGQDTGGQQSMTINSIKNFIEVFIERGWTITFLGTSSDVQNMLRIFPRLDDGNTQIIEHTGESFEAAFKTRGHALQNYAKAIDNGEDVTRGFFKSVN